MTTTHSATDSPLSSSFLPFLPNEKVLLESDDQTLTLTTYRVRYDAQNINRSEIISIMLEEVASCAVVRRRILPLLIVGAVAVLIGLFLLFNDNTDTALVFIVVGAVLLVAYYFTRPQAIEVASAGATINVRTSGMSLQNARLFINETEVAKDARGLR